MSINSEFFKYRIKIEYYVNERLAGINHGTQNSVGGLTKEFFYKCKEQLYKLYSKKYKKGNNLYNDAILYYFGLPETNLINIIKLLIISKINGCPIYFNIIDGPLSKLFNEFHKNILGMIVTNYNNYSSLQKIVIINILRKFKDIINNNLGSNGIFQLLLSDKNSERIVNNEKYNLKNIISSYISNINTEKVGKSNVNTEKILKRNKNHNDNILNIKKNGNSDNIGIRYLNKIFIDFPNIYKDGYIGFYLSHFCFDEVTFNLFMKNLKFINKGCDFSNEIVKLLEYMNKNNEADILLLARAITGNSSLMKEYIINMLPTLSGNKGFNKPFDFHTCFNYANCYEDAFRFNYLITDDEEKNKEVLKNFISFLKTILNTDLLQ